MAVSRIIFKKQQKTIDKYGYVMYNNGVVKIYIARTGVWKFETEKKRRFRSRNAEPAGIG